MDLIGKDMMLLRWALTLGGPIGVEINTTAVLMIMTMIDYEDQVDFVLCAQKITTGTPLNRKSPIAVASPRVFVMPL